MKLEEEKEREKRDIERKEKQRELEWVIEKERGRERRRQCGSSEPVGESEKSQGSETLTSLHEKSTGYAPEIVFKYPVVHACPHCLLEKRKRSTP